MNSSSACPVTRGDVIVEPSESVGGRERYIVAVDWHHFLVDRATACLIEALRAQTTYKLLAEHMRHQVGDSLDPDFLREVVENQLPPAIFQPSEGGQKTPFSWRVHLFSGEALEPLVRVASRLVNKPLAMAFLVLLIAVDAAVLAKWIQDPVPLRGGGMTHWLPVMGLVLVGVLIHELGHVSALRRFGRRSGGIGFGIYWIFPTFYADVSEAWRLRARHRAVVDAGGLYFQGVYMVGIGAWALVSRDPVIPLLVMWISHFMMLYTLNPTLKFDGYWLLTDLTGYTNLHSRITDCARQVVARLLGRPGQSPLGNSQKWALAGFSTATVLYFGYLFVSLGAALVRTVQNLFSGTDHSRGDIITAVIVASLLSLIVLVLMRRCVRALWGIFKPEVPATSGKEAE